SCSKGSSAAPGSLPKNRAPQKSAPRHGRVTLGKRWLDRLPTAVDRAATPTPDTGARMKHTTCAALSAACFALAAALPAAAAPGVTSLGKGSIPGTTRDNSGLRGLLEDGVTPGNQVGGLGSAITYSGIGDLFYATPDRGPADGTTTYVDR